MTAGSTLKYPYIRAWGLALNSMDYYIRRQVEQAQIDNAPPEAIFKADNGQWQTLSDCVPEIEASIRMIAASHGLVEAVK